MGRNTAGMELKCEKFKHSGHYPRTEDSAGSRHRSCTALPLLTSEAYRDICKDGISPFSMASVHTFGQTCSGGSRLFAGDSPSSSWSSDSLVWAAFDNQLCMRGTAHSSERETQSFRDQMWLQRITKELCFSIQETGIGYRFVCETSCSARTEQGQWTPDATSIYQKALL